MAKCVDKVTSNFQTILLIALIEEFNNDHHDKIIIYKVSFKTSKPVFSVRNLERNDRVSQATRDL